MANAEPRTYTAFMADAANRRNKDLSYSPVPQPPRKEQGKSAAAGLAAVSLLAAAVVYMQFLTPVPAAVDNSPPAVMERLPPTEAASAPAQETGAAAALAAKAPVAPLKEAPAAPVTESPSEAVFTHYTTEPGFVSRAVVRINGKVVHSRNLFRGKKSEGGADIRAMSETPCASTFLMYAGGKPIYKDAVTAALPAAQRYSMEVRWYDADGDELSRDAFDVDGKKAIQRSTQFRSSNVPMLAQNRIGGASIEGGGISTPNADSMNGEWNVPKRPSWQPELPQQASFFAQ